MIYIITEDGWALGRIYRQLEKVLKEEKINVEFIDWNKRSDVVRATVHFVASNNVFLIGNTGMIYAIPSQLRVHWGKREWARIILTVHAPVIGDKHFTERIWSLDANYTAVSFDAAFQTTKRIGREVVVTPFGFSYSEIPKSALCLPETFIVGYVSKHSTEEIVRRVSDKLGCTCLDVHSRPTKPYVDVEELYKGISVFVVASDFDTGPLGAFEAAACGIPIIVRRNGCNAMLIDNAFKFTTEEELYKLLLCAMQKKKEELEIIGRVLREEIKTKWKTDFLIRKHLMPVISHVTGQ